MNRHKNWHMHSVLHRINYNNKMLASETAVPKYSPPTTMDGMRAPQR